MDVDGLTASAAILRKNVHFRGFSDDLDGQAENLGRRLSTVLTVRPYVHPSPDEHGSFRNNGPARPSAAGRTPPPGPGRRARRVPAGPGMTTELCRGLCHKPK